MSQYLVVRDSTGKMRDVSDSNGYPMQLMGRKVKDVFSGSTTTTRNTFGTGKGFSIVNDGAPDLTFTIGGKTITVKQNETWDAEFDDFTSVTVTATGAFRAVVKG